MLPPLPFAMLGWPEILMILWVLIVFGALIVGAIAVVIWTSRRSAGSPPATSPPPASPSLPPGTPGLCPPAVPAQTGPDAVGCPKCGSPPAGGAAHGLCPRCLLEAGIGTRPAAEPSGPPAAPDPAELAAAFPQLEILEPLGQGGMGIVYRARQRKLDRQVALKVLPRDAGRDPSFAERFHREARALALLNHPNIVTVHDFGESAGLFYLIMEYVDGADLRRVLEQGHLSAAEALRIVPVVCDALQFAHAHGVVHRDIKPANILLDRDGRVKIADFGIAKLAGGTVDITLTRSRQSMGTPHYMAPEQVENPESVDHRADIYSLGVVFYEMLTGELPIGRFAAPSHRVQLDVRLDEVVLRALEKEPERRFQRVGDVKTEVERIAGTPPGPGGVTHPSGVHRQAVVRSPNLSPKRRGLAVAAVLFVLLPVLMVIAYGLLHRFDRKINRSVEPGATSVWVPAPSPVPAPPHDAGTVPVPAPRYDTVSRYYTTEFPALPAVVPSEPSSRGIPWRSTPEGPVLAEGPLVQVLGGRDSESVRVVNAALRDSWQEYLSSLRTNLSRSTNARGHTVIVVAAMTQELDRIENRFWTRADAVTTGPQQAVLRQFLGPHLRGRWLANHQFENADTLFRFGVTRYVLEYWRVGTWYHWNSIQGDGARPEHVTTTFPNQSPDFAEHEILVRLSEPEPQAPAPASGTQPAGP